MGCTDHGNLGKFEEKMQEYKDIIEVEVVDSKYLDQDYKDDDIKIFRIRPK